MSDDLVCPVCQSPVDLDEECIVLAGVTYHIRCGESHSYRWSRVSAQFASLHERLLAVELAVEKGLERPAAPSTQSKRPGRPPWVLDDQSCCANCMYSSETHVLPEYRECSMLRAQDHVLELSPQGATGPVTVHDHFCCIDFRRRKSDAGSIPG